jgi:hypothetical protein
MNPIHPSEVSANKEKLHPTMHPIHPSKVRKTIRRKTPGHWNQKGPRFLVPVFNIWCWNVFTNPMQTPICAPPSKPNEKVSCNDPTGEVAGVSRQSDVFHGSSESRISEQRKNSSHAMSCCPLKSLKEMSSSEHQKLVPSPQ